MCACMLGVDCIHGIELLEMMYAIWCCRDIVSSHVLVHLRETLLDVVLCAAFSHCGKSKSLRGMVQLQKERKTDMLPSEGLQKVLILINIGYFTFQSVFHFLQWAF